MHRGICIGGPMAGQTITTRSDRGFVAIDAPGLAAWIYLIGADGGYRVDTAADVSLLDADGTRALDRERAAAAGTEKGLDVIALPGADDEPAAPAPVLDDGPDDEEGDF